MSFLSSGIFRDLESLGEMSHRHRSFHRLLNRLSFSFVLVLMTPVTRDESRASINNFVAEVVF